MILLIVRLLLLMDGQATVGLFCMRAGVNLMRYVMDCQLLLSTGCPFTLQLLKSSLNTFTRCTPSIHRSPTNTSMFFRSVTAAALKAQKHTGMLDIKRRGSFEMTSISVASLTSDYSVWHHYSLTCESKLRFHVKMTATFWLQLLVTVLHRRCCAM